MNNRLPESGSYDLPSGSFLDWKILAARRFTANDSERPALRDGGYLIDHVIHTAEYAALLPYV
jgi:hypothetical protein